MTRRARWSLSIVVVLVAGTAYAGREAARTHVQRQTGTSDPVDLDCSRCHGEGLPLGGTVAEVATGHPDPAGLAVSPDGRRLLVACEGTDQLRILDTADLTEIRTIDLAEGSLPHGVVSDDAGRTAFVSLRGHHRIAAIDLESGAVRESGFVVAGPTGLALRPGGDLLIAAGSASEDVALLDPQTLEVLVRLAAGREPYRVAVSPDGRYAHVVSRLSAVHGPEAAPVSEVTVVDLDERTVAARVELPSCHMSEGIAFLEDGRAVVPVIRVRNRMPIVQVERGWVMSSGLAVVPADGRGDVHVMPLDSMDRYEADPAGIAVTPDGATAWLVAGGSDGVIPVDLAAMISTSARLSGNRVDAIDRLDLAADYVGEPVRVRSNPREIVLSPDGRRAYVSERWTGSIAILDTQTRRVLARTDLGGPDRVTAARRGDRVFHNAAVTFQGQFSCRSCHPDGHQDGLAYDFEPDGCGRNVVDNRSLHGIHGTEPFKWIGLNRNAKAQCGPRFAKVLTRADPFPDAELDDLVAYLESLPSGYRGYGAHAPHASAAARRGREIFLRSETGDGTPIPESDRCVTCHPPPNYTNRKLTDVGTRGPGDDFAAFDVPHLRGVGRTAPYLHDGRALTLEEIWTRHDPELRHGKVDDLTKQQLNDLVEFLKGL
ncbi:MAG: hypothetical protein ACYTG4_03130 [Planctomycetota bacterium]|jgi:DNA-binding beta-propeller fold protein YncE